jgi:glycosyltransferase involved in cell wall biosynthesis
VHELESVIRATCGVDVLHSTIPHITRFVAVSKIVKDNLVANHQVPEERIETIPEFVPLKGASTSGSVDIRRSLKIPEDAHIVGGSGTIEWRKGTDLFIQVARRVLEDECRRPVHFIWLGDSSEKSEFRRQTKVDVDRMGIQAAIHFPGSQPNPQDYFDAFDLFVMASREDPFPLVCIENAMHGNPIICFQNAVGSTEFIDETCGSVVPYMDVEAMSREIKKWLADEPTRSQAGEVIKRRSRQYTTAKIAPMIMNLMKETIRCSKSRKLA